MTLSTARFPTATASSVPFGSRSGHVSNVCPSRAKPDTVTEWVPTEVTVPCSSGRVLPSEYVPPEAVTVWPTDGPEPGSSTYRVVVSVFSVVDTIAAPAGVGFTGYMTVLGMLEPSRVH